MSAAPRPRSLVWATDIDVLPADRVVEHRDRYTVVRSPRNPTHHWGNVVLFDEPPSSGDAPRWEVAFDDAFGDDVRVRHRAFGWDRTDGTPGAARDEFVERGYDVEEMVGLVASPNALRAHPRQNRDVVVRAVDPAEGADEAIWAAVVELQVEGRDPRYDEPGYRAFAGARLAEQRTLFRAGRGAWYVAADPASRAVVASCGIVVTDGRARFQAVDTAAAHRRRGIASRLLIDAARHAADRYGAKQFVIVADAAYHALPLYESLGFERREHVFGVCQRERPRVI